MPYTKYPLLNKQNLKTVSIRQRKSLVQLKHFASPSVPGTELRGFLDLLPDFLAAKDLKDFFHHMQEARKNDKPIVWGMGAHVVKVGLSRVIIDLMERGWISALAVNGAFMIHDFEIALAGETSEDVAFSLHQGTFGTTQETGLFLNLALKEGVQNQMGGGEAVGHYLSQSQFPHKQDSILYRAYTLNIPVTVHQAIGCDFIHYHPMFSGEAAGILSERDFILFASIVSRLSPGGVYLNVGSAVVLPEIFLKAVSFCTGQGISVKQIYTAVFDFEKQYRPWENVCRRPAADGGKGFYFIGHHEIMIPLLAALMVESVHDHP